VSKPKFDPSKPFEASKPAFDPSRPVDAAPTEPAGPSRTEAALRGAAQGATVGFAEETNGFLQALGRKYLPDSLGGSPEQLRNVSLGDLYRMHRDAFRAEDQAAEAAHPGYYLGGNVVGGLPLAIASGGKAGGARTLGQVVRHGAKVGGLTGAAYGLGSSGADLTRGDVGQAGFDATLGGLLGGTLGAGAPLLSAGVGWTARNIGAPIMSAVRGGFVKPTPEAQRLTQKGVELSLGQMDPASGFGRLEELAAGKALGGASVTAARERGAAGARDALLESAGLPGATPPTRGAPVAQQLEELRGGFSKAYDDALGGAKLEPEKYLGNGKWRGLLTDESVQGAAKTKGAFELAAYARDIDASPVVRERALGWLTDKAQALMPTKSGPNAGKVDARSIHALRTQLRDKIRSLGKEGDDRGLREIYGRAEGFVTELLEGQLPPERAALLRSADAHYRNLLSVEDASDAVRAFRADGEFSPLELLNVIRKRGATPELEGVARDAYKTLTAKYAPTGIQVAATESIPLLKTVGPAWAALANAGLRNHALNPKWQPGLPARALTATGRWLEGAARSSGASTPAARTLQELLFPEAAPPPPFYAMAEDER
jgi:hypothetical protein